jgi:putative transposase
MARIARVVVPGIPHHVTQRGVRSMDTFYRDDDFIEYASLLKKNCEKWGVLIWAYCLMTNHVHFIAVPEREESLRKAFGDTHQEYTRYINFRENCRGYLWQGRFGSCPMDNQHLYHAIRYVENNPVKAGMVEQAWEYEWSSAGYHVEGDKDEIVTEWKGLREMISDWRRYLEERNAPEVDSRIGMATRTGKPLGTQDFIMHIEESVGRVLRKKKRGPKGPWKHKN